MPWHAASHSRRLIHGVGDPGLRLMRQGSTSLPCSASWPRVWRWSMPASASSCFWWRGASTSSTSEPVPRPRAQTPAPVDPGRPYRRLGHLRVQPRPRRRGPSHGALVRRGLDERIPNAEIDRHERARPATGPPPYSHCHDPSPSVRPPRTGWALHGQCDRPPRATAVLRGDHAEVHPGPPTPGPHLRQWRAGACLRLRPSEEEGVGLGGQHGSVDRRLSSQRPDGIGCGIGEVARSLGQPGRCLGKAPTPGSDDLGGSPRPS